MNEKLNDFGAFKHVVTVDRLLKNTWIMLLCYTHNTHIIWGALYTLSWLEFFLDISNGYDQNRYNERAK